MAVEDDVLDLLFTSTPHQSNGTTRASCCGSCAFRAGPGTVRPYGVSVDKVTEISDDFCDFVCHTPDDDGTYPTCAGWAARRET